MLVRFMPRAMQWFCSFYAFHHTGCMTFTCADCGDEFDDSDKYWLKQWKLCKVCYGKNVRNDVDVNVFAAE